MSASERPVSFCSYCGRPPASGQSGSRICSRCEMGLLLTAEDGLAPVEGDAFLVSDERLLVRALSRAGEELLERSEPSAIHGPVGSLITGVNADGSPDAPLLRLLIAAASGALSMAATQVALTGDPRRRYAVRVGPCGPPPAALLVFEGELP